jgi:hypothetical protein
MAEIPVRPSIVAAVEPAKPPPTMAMSVYFIVVPPLERPSLR